MLNIGDIVNNWLVLEYHGYDNHKHKLYKCQCQCENKTISLKTLENIHKHKSCNKEKCHFKFVDLTTKRFNNIIVKEFAYFKNHKSYWKCECLCGKKDLIIIGTLLTTEKIKSCGCLSSKENKIKRNIFTIWKNIIDRNLNCYSSDNIVKTTPIRICTEWYNFNNFYMDVKDSYKYGYILSKIDKSKMYNKENYLWKKYK